MADDHRLQPGQPMATASAATENREVVLDEPPAAAGENGRTARKTRTVLLAPVGREPSDSAVICQYAGADRGVVVTGGIAQAVAPKKTIPIPLRNAEVSEKDGFRGRDDGFSGPRKGAWMPLPAPQRKIVRWKGSVGGMWAYTPDRRRVKKLIPVK